MSLDLTHGFLAEMHIEWRVANNIFAGNFLTRHGKRTTSIAPGSDLTLWFDTPRLRLVETAGPAQVEVDLFMTARLSDRFDEGRVGLTARGPVVDLPVTVGGESRVCPTVDFSGTTAEGLTLIMSTNAEYDASVRTVVANLLRGEKYAVGPLMSPAGKRFYRSYFEVPGHENVGLLAVFVAPFGEPPTPPGVDTRLSPLQEVILLVPDDLVRPAIDRGLAQAGLATMPADLNENVRVNTFDVSLQNGHIRIAATGRAQTEVIGLEVGADLSFTGFFQLLIEPDDTIKVHVISIQHDIDSPLLDVADFFSAGAITRLLEELVPGVVTNLVSGLAPDVGGLDVLSRTAPNGVSAPATPGPLLSIFANGLGITWKVTEEIPAQLEPPFIRGHQQSREFHVQPCPFGDLISSANLKRFPSHQAALRAGYDGCATCQPDFSVASFGDLSVRVAHPADVEPGLPVTIRADYAGNVERFGVTLAPDPEQFEDASPFDDEGVPTNSATFANLVPAPWMVTLSCGSWTTSATIDVARRFRDATGTVQGPVTRVRATVGQDGLALDP